MRWFALCVKVYENKFSSTKRKIGAMTVFLSSNNTY